MRQQRQQPHCSYSLAAGMLSHLTTAAGKTHKKDVPDGVGRLTTRDLCCRPSDPVGFFVPRLVPT